MTDKPAIASIGTGQRTRPDLASLLGFLRITPSEEASLREQGRGIASEERDRFVDAFYAHLQGYPELVDILAVPGRVDHLRKSMRQYLDTLLEAPLDDAYLAGRVATGQAHVRVGLLPRWYLGAYAMMLSWWMPRLAAEPGGAEAIQGLLKRILLDSTLAMESYVSGRVAGLAEEKEVLDRQARERGERLRESEARYQDLVEKAPEMIHQVDAERRFVRVNQTELDRLGYTLAEMHQMKLEDVVPPAYRHGIREHFEKVRESGSSRLETVFRTRSGEEFPVEVYATAQRDGEGRFLQTRAFVRDLTETRRLESELVRWERLAAVGSMAAKVAHEIRNPLSAISLNVELLADEVSGLPEARARDSQQILSTILGEVDRLNAIIEEYLAFARLPRLELRETSLQEIFYQLQHLMTLDLERHGVRLTMSIDDDLPSIHGDARQLQQVLMNLVRNSQEAMPDGGEIRLKALALPEAIEIIAADTGIGISEEGLSRIFDPFFTTKHSGTGLGLAYVQQVLREHGARIVCHSKVGQGTEFRILIPRPGAAGDPATRRKIRNTLS